MPPEGSPDAIATYIADRRPAQPERVEQVLRTSLSGVHNVRTLLDTGWVGLAATRVYTAYIAGARAATVYNELTRLTAWLEGRGEIGAWERATLQHAIDEARYAHGVAAERPSARPSHADHFDTVESLGARFAATRSHPVERELAPRTVRVLEVHLDAQLGRGHGLPFGALDVDVFVQSVLVDMEGDMDASCTLFGLCAAFYRWLGAEDRLDAERAAEQAGKLAAASLGTQMAFAS